MERGKDCSHVVSENIRVKHSADFNIYFVVLTITLQITIF